MKSFAFLTCLLASSIVHAELATNVSVTSDYLWRGQSQTSTSPSIQGSAEYKKDFFSIGTWLSSLSGDNTGAEVDLYAALHHKISDNYEVSFSATNYIYTKDSNLSFLEYGLNLTNPIAEVFIAFTDEYAGSDTSSLYYGFSRSFTLDKVNKVGLSLAAGLTTFNNEETAGSRDYIDYKIGLTKENDNMTYELFYSDTDRKTWDGVEEADAKDSTLGVSLTLNL